MATEDKVFMDTNVFTEIVDDIQGAANACVFPDNSISKASSLDTFDAGKEMHAILEEIHKTTEFYRHEVSESLPQGFLTMRDSMIAIDKEASESLTVDGGGIGGANKQ